MLGPLTYTLFPRTYSDSFVELRIVARAYSIAPVTFADSQACESNAVLP